MESKIQHLVSYALCPYIPSFQPKLATNYELIVIDHHHPKFHSLH